jgi:hypothetical protein
MHEKPRLTYDASERDEVLLGRAASEKVPERWAEEALEGKWKSTTSASRTGGQLPTTAGQTLKAASRNEQRMIESIVDGPSWPAAGTKGEVYKKNGIDDRTTKDEMRCEWMLTAQWGMQKERVSMLLICEQI